MFQTISILTNIFYFPFLSQVHYDCERILIEITLQMSEVMVNSMTTTTPSPSPTNNGNTKQHEFKLFVSLNIENVWKKNLGSSHTVSMSSLDSYSKRINITTQMSSQWKTSLKLLYFRYRPKVKFYCI